MTGKRAAVSMMMMAAAGLAACDGINDPSQAGNLVPKTVDEDSAIPALALAGTVFHYETFGDPSKPAIIFLHGGPGVDSRELLRLVERHDGYALTDDHFVVIWDQRGSGLSRRHDCGTYSLEQMDADLDAVVDHVSPDRPVVLIGHSWGGMYATLYINRHPEKVAGAVLMEPGPLNKQMFDAISGDIYSLDVFSEWLNDDVWDDQFLTPDDHARADYHRMLGLRDSQPKFHQSAIDPAPCWRLGAVASRCVMAAGMKDGKATYDFTDHLAAYSQRVLFVASALNEVIGVAFQERQRQFFPASDLVTIVNAGHDMQWTHTAETLAAIHTYLSTLGTVQR